MKEREEQEFGDKQPWTDRGPPGRTAVPVHRSGFLLGVVFVESGDTTDPRNFQDPGTQEALARHLEAAIITAEVLAPMRGNPLPAAVTTVAPSGTGNSPATRPGMRLRLIGSNNSIFVDGHYLIKGVAAALLWKMLKDYQETGRDEFSTRELRLERDLNLPDVNDNLRTRVILLRRRLMDFGDDLLLETIQRGRFRLVVRKPITLVEG